MADLIADLSERLRTTTADLDATRGHLDDCRQQHTRALDELDELVAAIDTWASTGGMHVRATSRARVAAQARLVDTADQHRRAHPADTEGIDAT